LQNLKYPTNMPIDIRKELIRFPNNNVASAVFPLIEHHPDEIVAALNLRPFKAVMLLIGGAANMDEKAKPMLAQLFARGIARAAIDAQAVIVDGGTQTGVMSLMGEAIAGRDDTTDLVGVSPFGKIALPGIPEEGTPLEPNHTHFVLVEGYEWGSETSTMFGLVRSLSSNKPKLISEEPPAGKLTTVTAGISLLRPKKIKPRDARPLPVVTILAGGGNIARNEVLQVVRNKMPMIVIKGSGGLADTISTAWENRGSLPEDPVMAEIIADGKISTHVLGNPILAMEKLIIRELGVNKVLTQAWETFADYDLNAKLQQKRFDMLQLAIIAVGVCGTALVVIQQVSAPRDADNSLRRVFWIEGEYGWWLLNRLIILVPISLTVLIAAANRFKQGNKWLLLRAGAEAIKREIFRYRTGAMQYKTNPDQQLSQMVENITRRTMRTEVNQSALVPYDKEMGFPPDMYAAKGGDDGLSRLTPDRYVEVRLGDQLSYFIKKSGILERQLKFFSWLTYIVGGIGTYLAAVELPAWIALTTAIVAAIGVYMGYRQTENTLIKYNQAATDLANVKAWWNALTSDEQSQPANIDKLVEHTEQVLQSELDGWIQQMQNALAEIRKDQPPVEEVAEKKEPVEVNDKTTAMINKSVPVSVPEIEVDHGDDNSEETLFEYTERVAQTEDNQEKTGIGG
jgi:truncated hemoglobin YjbI